MNKERKGLEVSRQRHTSDREIIFASPLGGSADERGKKPSNFFSRYVKKEKTEKRKAPSTPLAACEKLLTAIAQEVIPDVDDRTREVCAESIMKIRNMSTEDVVGMKNVLDMYENDKTGNKGAVSAEEKVGRKGSIHDLEEEFRKLSADFDNNVLLILKRDVAAHYALTLLEEEYEKKGDVPPPGIEEAIETLITHAALRKAFTEEMFTP